MPELEIYLGDGLYADFDGYHIRLQTQRENGWHEIALEPAVFAALLAYANTVWGVKAVQESADGA